VMNRGFYDRLAPAQKKVIDDHCNNEWAGKVGAAWGDDEDSGQGKLEKARVTTSSSSRLPQLEAWKKAVEPVTGQWQENVGKSGVNGPQVLSALRQELKARNAGQ